MVGTKCKNIAQQTTLLVVSLFNNNLSRIKNSYYLQSVIFAQRVWKLDIEFDVKIAFRDFSKVQQRSTGIFAVFLANRHSFPFDQGFSLRRHNFIDRDCYLSIIKSPYNYWFSFECFLQVNLFSINEVVSISFEVWVRNLSEFYQKYTWFVSVLIVAFSWELYNRFCWVSWLNIDHHFFSFGHRWVAIKLEDLTIKFYSFWAAVVEFFKSAIYEYFIIYWRSFNKNSFLFWHSLKINFVVWTRLSLTDFNERIWISKEMIENIVGIPFELITSRWFFKI